MGTGTGSGGPESPTSPFSAPSTPGVNGLTYFGDDALQGSSSSSGSLDHPKKRKRRKFTLRGEKEVDRDTLRLRQLGYDPALGRDYTFWSSLSISWLNIGCIQVCLGGCGQAFVPLMLGSRARSTPSQAHTVMGALA